MGSPRVIPRFWPGWLILLWIRQIRLKKQCINTELNAIFLSDNASATALGLSLDLSRLLLAQLSRGKHFFACPELAEGLFAVKVARTTPALSAEGGLVGYHTRCAFLMVVG
jgi:hypothetical protein